MKRLLVTLVMLGALCVGAYFAWSHFGRDEKPAYRFESVVVDRGPVVAKVTATGTLSALVTVQVGSQVSGRIQKLFVDFNSPVKKGQLIAKIDPALFEAAVQHGRANVAAARGAIEVARAAIVVARGNEAAARGALQAAKGQLAAAEGTLVAAKARAREAKVQHARSVQLAGQKLIAPSDLDKATAEARATAAQVEAAEGAVAQAKGGLAQSEGAVAQAAGAVQQAQGTLAQSKGALAQAKASLHQARINLEFTDIVSPTNGVVISRNVDVGQTVAASLQAPVLFLIAEDLAKMQVDTNVAEADVGRLRAGMTATFNVDAYPRRRFRGVVRQIRNAPQTLQNVVTYDAVIDVENRELLLRPGMTANVTFVHAERKDALRVPNAALRFRPPKTLRAEGASASTPSGKRAQRTPTGGRADGGAAATSRPASAQRDAGAADERTVWLLVGDAAQGPGTLKAARIRIGISDGSSTEVVSGELKGGERLVIEAVPTRPRKQRTSGGLKRMM